jgi:hypothetical protein
MIAIKDCSRAAGYGKFILTAKQGYRGAMIPFVASREEDGGTSCSNETGRLW